MAVQNRQNAVYGELLLPLELSEEELYFEVKVIGHPFETGVLKLSGLLEELFAK